MNRDEEWRLIVETKKLAKHGVPYVRIARKLGVSPSTLLKLRKLSKEPLLAIDQSKAEAANKMWRGKKRVRVRPPAPMSGSVEVQKARVAPVREEETFTQAQKIRSLACLMTKKEQLVEFIVTKLTAL